MSMNTEIALYFLAVVLVLPVVLLGGICWALYKLLGK